MSNSFLLDWKHLNQLTDTVGLFEHANGNIPNKEYAYCTDDNARAFLFTCYYHYLTKAPSILPLMRKYITFLHYSYNQESQWFRNRLSLKKEWDNVNISEAAHGQTLLCLGAGTLYSPNDIKPLCYALFKKGLPQLKSTKEPHTIALGIIGLYYILKTNLSKEYLVLINQLTQKLDQLFQDNDTDENWPWYCNKVTWGSAIIARGLILGATSISNKKLLQKGQSLLNWLISKQYKHKNFSFIGNKGWLERGKLPALFDQQAIEAYTMLEACTDSELIFKNCHYIHYAKSALDWFFGKNLTSTPMINTHSGGCFDGLLKEGVNPNQGAESTLSWLLSACKLELTKRDLLLKGEQHESKKISETLY